MCLLEFPQLCTYISCIIYMYVCVYIYYSQACGAGQRTLTIWTFELLPRAVTLLLSGSRSRWIKSVCTVEMPVKLTWSEAVACTGQGRTVSKHKAEQNLAGSHLPGDTSIRNRAYQVRQYRPEKHRAGNCAEYIHFAATAYLEHVATFVLDPVCDTNAVGVSVLVIRDADAVGAVAHPCLLVDERHFGSR